MLQNLFQSFYPASLYSAKIYSFNIIVYSVFVFLLQKRYIVTSTSYIAGKIAIPSSFSTNGRTQFSTLVRVGRQSQRAYTRHPPHTPWGSARRRVIRAPPTLAAPIWKGSLCGSSRELPLQKRGIVYGTVYAVLCSVFCVCHIALHTKYRRQGWNNLIAESVRI